MPGDVRIDGLNGAGRGLYRALPGLPDEMVDAEGAIRPLWRRLAGHIGALDAEALTRDLARADWYLLDSGVFFRQYLLLWLLLFLRFGLRLFRCLLHLRKTVFFFFFFFS